jgi:hypothetical protein
MAASVPADALCLRRLLRSAQAGQGNLVAMASLHVGEKRQPGIDRDLVAERAGGGREVHCSCGLGLVGWSLMLDMRQVQVG